MTSDRHSPSPSAVGAARDIVAAASGLARATHALLSLREQADQAVRSAYELVRDRELRAGLEAVPVESLQDVTPSRLRVNAVAAAGYATVADVLDAGAAALDALPGVGPTTARQLTEAAIEIEGAMRASLRIRFDVERRPPDHGVLLDALRGFEVVSRVVDPIRSRAGSFADALDADLGVARLETRRIRRLFAGRRRREAARVALDRLSDLLGAPATSDLRAVMADATARLDGFRPEPADVWDDFASRPIAYNGLLALVTGHEPDSAATRGYLPDDIVARIGEIELDTSLLTATLRGYQAFGARFALAQVRTILGDEMGLGKTIQALAVFCHLHTEGHRHFLVVCPASVLANWHHETARHTRLAPILRLHGPDRDENLRRWVDGGGVAITTFATLRGLPVPDVGVAAIVVDEAHYVKNPDAQRTRAVEAWLERPSYTMLMTGTPMENRVGELRSLVEMIRPDLSGLVDPAVGLSGPDAFRRSLAPVYLRRNQVDVLYELPARIEAAEWLTLPEAAEVAYRRAVASGNFMAMRRAAFMTDRPADSPKLVRLLEIVDEAVANNRKVVVFSYFLDVVDRVHAALGGRSFGTLTGAVAATARQELVYRFTAHPEPAVLVAQIEAGGVGLNIQAASVVILTEPQWKPSTEEQAIARCYRLGQVRPVEVHRLLVEDSVDERMVEVLRNKSELFDRYARQSALRDASPDATDKDVHRAGDSIADLERTILVAERQRLSI